MALTVSDIRRIALLIDDSVGRHDGTLCTSLSSDFIPDLIKKIHHDFPGVSRLASANE